MTNQSIRQQSQQRILKYLKKTHSTKCTIKSEADFMQRPRRNFAYDIVVVSRVQDRNAQLQRGSAHFLKGIGKLQTPLIWICDHAQDILPEMHRRSNQ